MVVFFVMNVIIVGYIVWGVEVNWVVNICVRGRVIYENVVDVVVISVKGYVVFVIKDFEVG